MAAITAAVVVGVGSAYAANRQGAAAKEQGRAARDAANLGIGAQQDARDQFNTQMKPYVDAGTGALSQLSAINNGDYSGFNKSPDYLYARDQMQQGIERGAAARGGLYSGGTSVDLGNALNGIASQNLGTHYNRLMGLADMGNRSVMGSGQLGQQNANSISDLYGMRGQANGQINSAGAMTQAGYGNALASAFGAYSGAGGGFGGFGKSTSAAPQRTSSYGAFSPSSSGFGGFGTTGGSLGPTNGQWWNFGPGSN